MDVMRHKDLPRPGAINCGSPGWMIVWLEIALSSKVCECNHGRQDRDPTLDPKVTGSQKCRGLSMGRRKVVDGDPEAMEPERVLVLIIDWIIHVEPIGGSASERSGAVTERSSASLKMLSPWRIRS